MKKTYLALAILMTISMNAQASDAAQKPAAPVPAVLPVQASAMPAGEYILDPGHTSLSWRVKHFGTSYYTARFTNFDGKINFNPTDVTKSSLEVKIYPAFIATEFTVMREKLYDEKKWTVDFDKVLSTSDKWFNSEKFPEITFVSKNITKTGDNTGVIEGDLTMMGVTKTVKLNTTFNGGHVVQPASKLPTLGFSAKAVIKRSDWGLVAFLPNIADNVEIIIETEFEKRK
jgi:polyisoprenoid-binding protein YceI